MNKLYSRIVWENFPSEKTALNESNLNRMDLAIDNIDNRVIEMDATKVNKETANNLVKTWSIDEETGIITVEHLDGSKDLFDLNIEKIPVDFKLSEDGILTMTTDDGTQYTANIGAMIPVLTFEDSDTIAVSVSGEGVNKTYSFSIKSGSVTEDKLQPNFLADVKTEVAKAQASQSAAAQSASAASGSATMAESYTHGGTGAREGEDADNARYYMEQAKAVSAVNVATTETAGIVKPDGDTITVDPDGTIRGQSKVDEMTGATAEANGTSGTVPAPKAGQQAHILCGDGTWKSPIDNEIIAAKTKELNKAIEDAIALRASLEVYGLVKVTNSSAVTDSTGLALAATEKNSAIPGTLANDLSQLSNPNLLINPDFRINQRGGKISLAGTTLYDDADCTVNPHAQIETAMKVTMLSNGNYMFTNSGGVNAYIKPSDVVDGYCENHKYTLDRWAVYGISGYIKIGDKGLYLYKTFDFAQPFELGTFIIGETYTLSAKVDGEIHSFTFVVENGKQKLSKQFGYGWYFNTIQNWNNKDFISINIDINIDHVFHIEWMKLELGSVATPFVPPEPASELLKCKRYCELLRYKAYQTIGVASSISTWLNLMIPISEKRTERPSVSISMPINDGLNRRISTQPSQVNCVGNTMNIGFSRENETIGTNYCWAEADGYILIDAEIR